MADVSDRENIIDVLDDYFAFKANEASALDSGYAEYVYGHLQFNERHARDRAAIAERLRLAIMTPKERQ